MYIAEVLTNRQKNKAPKGAQVEVIREGNGFYGPYVLADYQGERIFLSPKNVVRVGDLPSERVEEIAQEREVFKAEMKKLIPVFLEVMKVTDKGLRAKLWLISTPEELQETRRACQGCVDTWLPLSQVEIVHYFAESEFKVKSSYLVHMPRWLADQKSARFYEYQDLAWKMVDSIEESRKEFGI